MYQLGYIPNQKYLSNDILAEYITKPTRRRRMTTRVCKNWIESFVKYVEEVESSYQYKLYTALALLGAASRKNIYQLLAGDTLYLNTFIALIGPSGNRKSAALNAGVPLLKQAGVIKFIEDAATSAKMLDRMARLEYSNGNGSKAQQAHAIVYADELTTFLTKSALKEGHSQVICKLLNCPDEYHHDTKSGGHVFLKDPYLQMIVATTPTGVVDTFTNLSWKGGLAGRAWFIIGGNYTKNPNPKPLNSLLADNLILDLRHIHSLSGEMKMSFKAQGYYEDWYMSVEIPEEDNAVSGLINRCGTTVRKLAALLSLAESDKLEIRLEDIKKAIVGYEMLVANFESLAMESSNVQFASNLKRVYLAVKRYHLSEQRPMTRTKLMYSVGKYMDKNSLDEAVDYLQDIKCIHIFGASTPNTDGTIDRSTTYAFVREIDFLERKSKISSYVLKQELEKLKEKEDE